MEKFSIEAKDSGVNRVVGVPAEREKEILKHFKSNFDKNPRLSIDGILEEDKDAETDKMIFQVNHLMKDFFDEYGLRYIDVPIEKIHIFNISRFREAGKKLNFPAAGEYLPKYQRIHIYTYDDRPNQYEKMLECLVHEILHLQSFQSWHKTNKDDPTLSVNKGTERLLGLELRRSGLQTYSEFKKEVLFKNINEAVTTQLTILFLNKYHNQLFSKEPDSEISYPYPTEREQLEGLISTLYEHNQQDFETKDDIFKLFVRGYMTGNLLPIARLIKKTFHEDWIFRWIGEHKS